jgi:hypothetical protein
VNELLIGSGGRFSGEASARWVFFQIMPMRKCGDSCRFGNLGFISEKGKKTQTLSQGA